jgi:predicted N-acyltransferase
MSGNYHIGVHEDPTTLDVDEWNALLSAQAQPTPFMQLQYLAALHASGSAVPSTGWRPRFVTLRRGGRLVAAAPAYLKSHSYGEYVFDWAWAEAYQRHGLRYYPKLLVAVPFTPVPGSRLLAASDEDREALLRALQQLAETGGWSSAHLLFHDEADARAVQAAGWMQRHNVQFHWQQREGTPYADFTDFLAALQRDKRKKIQQERRRVAEAGVAFTALAGNEIDEASWDFFYRCYTLTYRAHHSTPYLTRGFFANMAREMQDHWLMFVAHQGDEPIAASLVALDPGRRRAFGRYWGCTRPLPCLHFEACYYQPLQWCIAKGYQAFEGGAQGEHKMARGLLPEPTSSAHWLAHPAFADAVQDFLNREGEGVAAYVDELRERAPFKG